MNKQQPSQKLSHPLWQKLLGGALLLSCLFAGAAPCQALLGQDMYTVKTYFCGRKGKPCKAPELLGRMQTFAQVQKEVLPQSVSFFPDSRGTIQREQWLATPMSMWTIVQADKIRDAIMGGQRPSGVRPQGMENLVYLYADGSQLYYYVSHSQVYCIIAVAKSFNAGDGSRSAPMYYDYDKTRMIKPKS